MLDVPRQVDKTYTECSVSILQILILLCVLQVCGYTAVVGVHDKRTNYLRASYYHPVDRHANIIVMLLLLLYTAPVLRNALCPCPTPQKRYNKRTFYRRV